MVAGSFARAFTFLVVLACTQRYANSKMVFIQKQLTFNNCAPSSVFEVKSLEVDPYPPHFGQSVSLQATVNSKEQVSGGKVAVKVQGRGTLSFLNLSKEYDLCSVIPTSCPIKAGSTTISIRREIPNAPVPGSTFDVTIQATSNTGETLLCAKLPITID